MTNVIEVEFAEYQKPVAPSCIEVADMRSPAGRKSRLSYDAAKILPIRRDRQSKKRTPLKRQLTSKIAGETARDSRIELSRERSHVLFCRSSFKPRRDKLRFRFNLIFFVPTLQYIKFYTALTNIFLAFSIKFVST